MAGGAAADLPFEWIVGNEALVPVVRELSGGAAGGDAAGGKSVSLVGLGVGDSRVEVLRDALAQDGIDLQIVGVDVDASSVARGRKRRPDLDFEVCDLARHGSVEELILRRGRGAHFDIVYDKGTLDYIICQEVSWLCAFVGNVTACMGGETSKYVLVSFRERSLLLEILGLFGLVLEKEQSFGDTRQHGTCYVLGLAAAPHARGRGGEVASKVQDALDAHFSSASPLHGDGEVETVAGEIIAGAGAGKAELGAVYSGAIPDELKGEYDFSLFCEDVAGSLGRHVLERGTMTRAEIVEFLRANQ